MIAHTIDDFYAGRLKVYQPEQGFRAGTDSLLLASALDRFTEGEVLEVGCGAGGALLPAAHRLKRARFTGLELDPQMIELTELGIDANGFRDRITLAHRSADDLPND